MDYREILVEVVFFGGFLIIDKLTNSVICKVEDPEDPKVHESIIETLGEDIQYRLIF
jgi:hypothetical protein